MSITDNARKTNTTENTKNTSRAMHDQFNQSTIIYIYIIYEITPTYISHYINI